MSYNNSWGTEIFKYWYSMKLSNLLKQNLT